MKTIALLIAAFFILSCSAKKTNSLKSESETKTDLTVTQNQLSVLELDKTETAEGETCTDDFEPIDPEKPMVIDDGKGNVTTVLNGIKTTTKTKGKSQSNTKLKETVTTAAVAQVQQQVKVVTKAAATDRKETGSQFYTAGGIVIGLAIVGWCIWFFILRKKNTNENKA